MGYKVHTTNKINLYIYRFFFFRPVTALCLIKVTLQFLHLLSSKKNHHQQILTLTFGCPNCQKNRVLGVQMTRWTHRRLSPCTLDTQKVYETSIWTPCFKLLAKTLPWTTGQAPDLPFTFTANSEPVTGQPTR